MSRIHQKQPHTFWVRSTTVVAIAFIWIAGADRAQAQWSSPDANGKIYYNGGSVGVGLTNPSGVLELWKANSPAAYITRDAGSGSGQNQTLALGLDGSAGRAYVDSTHYTSGGYPLDFRVRSVTAMTIDVGGNVGIGTTNPSFKLAIQQNSTTSQQLALQNDTLTAGRYSEILFRHSNGAGPSGIRGYAVNLNSNNESQLRFFTSPSSNSPTERMIIDQAGNVGIGTTSPYTRLHVGGGDISVDGNQGLRKAGDNWIIGYSNSLPGIAIGSGSPSDQVQITAGGYERLRVLANGNVGIGITNPTYRLDVQGGQVNASGGFCINGSCRTNWSAVSPWENNSGSLSYTAGNVGIGTSSPGSKLDVNGNFFVRDSVGTGTQHLLLGYLNGAGRTIADLYSRDQVGVLDLSLGDGSISTRINGYGNSYFNGGNVGIGTATPASVFHIKRDGGSTVAVGTGDQLRIDSGATGHVAELHLTDGVTSDAQFTFVPSATLTSRYLNISTRSNLGDFTIRGDGNVGIGTTSPAVRGGAAFGLNISGTADRGIQVDSTSGNGNVLFTGNSSGNGNMYVTNNSPAKLFLGTGSYVSQHLAIDSSGYVGIGRTDPGYRLDVYGDINATGSLRINGTPISSSQWTGSGSISYSGGNVGIGTTAPIHRLQVDNASTGDNNIIDLNQTSGYAAGGRNFLRFSQGTGAPSQNFRIGYDNDTVSLQIRNSADTPVATFADGGNVGIGTASPSARLTVSGSSIDNGSTGIDFTNTNGGTFRLAAGVPGITNSNFSISQGGTAEVVVANGSGNVGIGIPSPGSYKLNVNGNTNITGDLNIAANGAGTGNIVAAGTIYAKYQDVAEWVPSSEQLSAGTVVVLDSAKSNQVTSSTVSYDTRVAGVVSERPGIALGEKSDSKVLVATTGRVKVKVDASKSPIRIGDLLVTSDVPGVAMKSEAVNLGGVQFHRPGTLIGKALEPLAKGSGEILVLLSLQ